MLRKFVAMCTFALAALLAWPALAFGGEDAAAATPYPAPPVTSGSIQELGASSGMVSPLSSTGAAVAAVPPAPGGGGLAYTGVSSDMMMVGAIAILCVLVGVSLVVLGARRATRRRPRHS